MNLSIGRENERELPIDERYVWKTKQLRKPRHSSYSAQEEPVGLEIKESIEQRTRRDPCRLLW